MGLRHAFTTGSIGATASSASGDDPGPKRVRLTFTDGSIEFVEDAASLAQADRLAAQRWPMRRIASRTWVGAAHKRAMTSTPPAPDPAWPITLDDGTHVWIQAASLAWAYHLARGMYPGNHFVPLTDGDQSALEAPLLMAIAEMERLVQRIEFLNALAERREDRRRAEQLGAAQAHLYARRKEREATAARVAARPDFSYTAAALGFIVGNNFPKK